MYADYTTTNADLNESCVDDVDEPVDPEFMSVLDKLYGDQDDVDLYAILELPKTATAAELRTAYKRLSLLFHPDKHSNSRNPDSVDRSEDAEVAFNRIASAYAILSDPSRRAIYDNFGYKALEEQGWQLATCAKSAPELRLEYLILKQKALESKELRLTQPKSTFSMGIDLTDLFDRYLKESPEERIIRPSPSVYEISLLQSVSAATSLKDSATLVGQVVAHNGIGIGSGALIWHHNCGRSSMFNGVTVDTELSYGRLTRGLAIETQAQRSFGERFVGSIGLSVVNPKKRGFLSLFGLSASLNVQLMHNTTARFELRFLNNPSLSTELSWSSSNEFTTRLYGRLSATNNSKVSIYLEKAVSWPWLNPPRGSGAAQGESEYSESREPDWSEHETPDIHKFKKGTVFCSIGFSTLDLLELTLGARCHISCYSRLSGQLRVSLQRGVTLKLNFLRGSQTYSFPFILSEYPDKCAIGYGLLVPVFAFAAIKKLIYEPYLMRHMERAEKSRRAKLKLELQRKRQEAVSIQNLMLSSATRIKELESNVSGLVINRAIYGCFETVPDSEKCDAGGYLTVDVTVPLQVLVENSQLKLLPGRWVDFQGFYDPTIGLSNISRKLYVRYTFRNSIHEVTVTENQGLAIPMLKHKIDVETPI